MLSLAFDQSMTFEKKNNDIGEKKEKKKKKSTTVYRGMWSSLDSTKHSKA